MKLCGGGKKLWSVVTLLQRGASRWCCSSVCAACDYERVTFFSLSLSVCGCVRVLVIFVCFGFLKRMHLIIFKILVFLALPIKTVTSVDSFISSVHLRWKFSAFAALHNLKAEKCQDVVSADETFYSPEINIRWRVWKKGASRLWLSHFLKVCVSNIAAFSFFNAGVCCTNLPYFDCTDSWYCFILLILLWLLYGPLFWANVFYLWWSVLLISWLN